MPHLRRVTTLAALVALSLVAGASPASAQQLIDASHDGDLAFMAFAFMVFVFVGLLFAIDKVRKRRTGP
jgi:ABC-type Na+ efflux pump permease subunit